MRGLAAHLTEGDEVRVHDVGLPDGETSVWEDLIVVEVTKEALVTKERRSGVLFVFTWASPICVSKS